MAGAATGAFLGSALGGGLGSFGGSTSGTSFIAPQQLPFLQDLFQRAQDFSRRPTFTGFDPFQLAGQQSAISAIPGIGIPQTQAAQQFLTSGALLDPASNPFLQATARQAINPIFEQLTESILPSIRGEASLTGNVGSSRQGIAEGLASRGALRSAGDITSNIFSRAFGRGVDALQAGIGLAPQVANLSLLPSQILSGIGSERRGLAQEQLLDPFTQLQRFQSLIGSPIVLSQQQGETGGSGLLGLGEKVFGGIGKALGF